MSTRRQKNQLELAFGEGVTGEARSAAPEGTEADTAAPRLESPAVLGPLMEAIVERDNLRRALAQVRRNRGAPGVDGMTVDDLAMADLSYAPPFSPVWDPVVFAAGVADTKLHR